MCIPPVPTLNPGRSLLQIIERPWVHLNVNDTGNDTILSKRTNQAEEPFNAGCGTWSLAILLGLICLVLAPAFVLIVVGLVCDIGIDCFLANHPVWVGGISCVIGFLAGMGFVLEKAEKAQKKQKDEQLQRRLNEAQLRWLEQQEKRDP